MSPLDQPDYVDDRTEDSEPGTEESEGLFGMPFLDHLEELRWRILKSILAVVILAIAAFYFSEELMQFLLAPMRDVRTGTGEEVRLHVTEVTGALYAYIKVSLIFGILASLPVVFYQLWAFISPGLYKRERRMVLPVVLISTLLFLVGAAFCYYVVLPFSLKFLIQFSGDLLSPIITVGSYITFSGMLLLSFGFGFEMPIAAYMLGKLGILTSRFMAKGRRYAIVIILIVAAVLTPTPDIFTQSLLAVPMYALYEISILVVRLTGRREKGREQPSEEKLSE